MGACAMITTTELQLVPLDKLGPYQNNARTHSPEQINKLRSSLREFGFINPVIIDRDYGIIAGHGRAIAAREEKLKHYKPTRFMAENSHYDKDAADHAVCFIEKFCCHTKGTWDGQPFELIDWQEQIIRDIFGVLKPNGYSLFPALLLKAYPFRIILSMSCSSCSAPSSSAGAICGIAFVLPPLRLA